MMYLFDLKISYEKENVLHGRNELIFNNSIDYNHR